MNELLSVCHINARSILANFIAFKDAVFNKYDLITVSESWLKPNIVNRVVDLPGYKIFRRDRSLRIGGGTAVYIKNSLKPKPITNLDNITSEQLWISFCYNNKTYALGSLYRPNDFSYHDFANDLDLCLGTLSPSYDYIVFAGDLNINFLEPSSLQCRTLQSIFDTYSLTQVVDQPTRGPKLLDIILCTEALKISNVKVTKCPLVSDHSMPSCYFGSPGIKKFKPFEFTFRDFRNFEPHYFHRDLAASDLQQIYLLNDIESKINVLNSTILNLFQIHAPLRQIKITRKKAPWLTDTLRYMMKLRDKALLKFKKSKNENHWNFYKSIRNEVNHAIKREKKAYFEFQLRRGKNMWKEMKKHNIISNKKSSSFIPDHLQDPDSINNYFVHGIGGHDIPDADVLNHYSSSKFPGVDNYSFTVIDELKVYEKILSIKSNASGHDNINITMILYCCPYILPFITHIFNFCLQKSIFPSVWKESKVIPLPKTDSPIDYNELRPISILCTFSKILEKVMDEQIRQHITKFHLLPEHQSGFRPG
uniref:Uncharacterized protein LOC114347572 n=1 Tax=Diabrotica virgifera virgifera TaxID=50390 RepID=A0A6P7HE79_DIAVI